MSSTVTMSTARILELRQYTLRPGARPDLVRLFERELIEPQEDVGIRVGGLFLDRDDPDRFVWFRGFDDLDARRRALTDFYHGPVWSTFRDAANATMLDSDDVLMLRATDPGHPMPEPAGTRAAIDATDATDEWVAVTIYVHDDPRLTSWLSDDVHGVLHQQLGVPVATFRTEPSENDFPALPVRSDNVFVWTAGFAGEGEYVDARRRLEESDTWRHVVTPRLEAGLTARQDLRLQPTARSQHQTTGRALGRRP